MRAILAGNGTEFIHSALQCRADDAFDQGDAQDTDKGLTVPPQLQLPTLPAAMIRRLIPIPSAADDELFCHPERFIVGELTQRKFAEVGRWRSQYPALSSVQRQLDAENEINPPSAWTMRILPSPELRRIRRSYLRHRELLILQISRCPRNREWDPYSQ